MGFTYNRAYRSVKIGDRVIVTDANRMLRGCATVMEKIDYPLQTMTLKMDEGWTKTIDNTWRSWRVYPENSNMAELLRPKIEKEATWRAEAMATMIKKGSWPKSDEN